METLYYTITFVVADPEFPVLKQSKGLSLWMMKKMWEGCHIPRLPNANTFNINKCHLKTKKSKLRPSSHQLDQIKVG